MSSSQCSTIKHFFHSFLNASPVLISLFRCLENGSSFKRFAETAVCMKNIKCLYNLDLSLAWYSPFFFHNSPLSFMNQLISSYFPFRNNEVTSEVLVTLIKSIFKATNLKRITLKLGGYLLLFSVQPSKYFIISCRRVTKLGLYRSLRTLLRFPILKNVSFAFNGYVPYLSPTSYLTILL